MAHTYWQKQVNEPLFPDILWSRPESKAGAGKLLVAGGDSSGFAAPGSAYGTALASGVGMCRVVLPDGIKKVVGGVLPDAEFVPSTPSGSFAKTALDGLLDNARWADLTLLAGDFGRNSETAVMIEHFVTKYDGLLCVAHDAVDYFKETPNQIVDRPDTLIVLSLAQLQKLFVATPTITPIALSMTTLQLVEALHDYTAEHPACIMTKHNDLLFCAHDGRVSTTKHSEKMWRVDTAARASVYWLQNPTKVYEAVTSSAVTEETQQ